MTPRKQTSKTRTPTPLPQSLDHFATWLRNNDRADHTVSTYLQTLRQFATWFEKTNGYPLTTENLTPSDIKQYREVSNIVETSREFKIEATQSVWLRELLSRY